MKSIAKSRALKAAWARPGMREKWSEALRNSRTRSATMKAAWRDPETRKRRTEGIRLSLNRPEVRRKLSKSISAALASPEARALKSSASRKVWSDPEFRKRHKKAMRAVAKNPEWLKKQHDRDRSQKHQATVKKNLERSGWSVFIGGWPDFICIKDSEIRFIEAKRHEEGLRATQKRTHEILSRFGIKVEVLRP